MGTYKTVSDIQYIGLLILNPSYKSILFSEYAHLGKGEFIEFENPDFNQDAVGKFINEALDISTTLFDNYFTKFGFNFFWITHLKIKYGLSEALIHERTT